MAEWKVGGVGEETVSDTAQRTQHFFVVRLWLEPDAVAATPQWRGSVEHSLTRQRHHFSDPADLLTFILARIGSGATDDQGMPAVRTMGQQTRRFSDARQKHQLVATYNRPLVDSGTVDSGQ